MFVLHSDHGNGDDGDDVLRVRILDTRVDG